jgi:hypothetical protein
MLHFGDLALERLLPKDLKIFSTGCLNTRERKLAETRRERTLAIRVGLRIGFWPALVSSGGLASNPDQKTRYYHHTADDLIVLPAGLPPAFLAGDSLVHFEM